MHYVCIVPVIELSKLIWEFLSEINSCWGTGRNAFVAVPAFLEVKEQRGSVAFKFGSDLQSAQVVFELRLKV